MAALGALDFFGDDGDGAAATASAAPVKKARKAAAAAVAAHTPPRPAWSEEDVNAFRNKLRLRVDGDGDAVPRPWAGWADGALDARLGAALERCEWREPTAVQAQACPALGAGRDVLVTAPTGSGKTGAFAVPAVAALLARTSKGEDPARRGPPVAVLAPTRELGNQIGREVRAICGGSGLGGSAVAVAPWTDGEFRRALVAVGTPAHFVASYADRRTAEELVLLVVDEADKLLDLTPVAGLVGERRARTSGFVGAVDAVLGKRPEACATGLFSATMSETVRSLAADALRPGRITVDVLPSLGAPLVAQTFRFVGEERAKPSAFDEAVRGGRAKPPCLVQCWNQSPVDGRPGISSNSSVSPKSNSFSMILEPLILASRVLDD